MITPYYSKTLLDLVTLEHKRNEEYKKGSGKSLKYDCIYPKMAKLVGLNIECNKVAKKNTCLCKIHKNKIVKFKCPFPECEKIKSPENKYCGDKQECVFKGCTNETHNNIFCPIHICAKCQKVHTSGNIYCDKCKCTRCNAPRGYYGTVCSNSTCKKCGKCSEDFDPKFIVTH